MAADNLKKQDLNLIRGKKTYWHLYSLQAIESEKLVRIINKILKREYMLIK